MPEPTRGRLPAGFIAFDLVGTLLLLAGVLERFGPSLPEPVGPRLAGYGWALIAAGVICMLMGGVALVKHIRSRGSPGLRTGSVRAAIPTVERSARQ
jgi:hypothetical protein